VNVAMALLIGVLGSVGVYLMLHRSLTRIILGIGMLGNAINLLIVAVGGEPGTAPIIGRDGTPSDPVPQALVLTAIVIGFGIVSILLAIAYRSWTIDGNDEVEDDIHDRRVAAEHDEPVVEDEIAPSEFASERELPVDGASEVDRP
jgi:multicomponent Na+:H+ antiporter subunit C